MSNCITTITPLKTIAKLKIDTNNDFVSTTLYKQIIGFLRYLCNKRPEIGQSIGLLSRFMKMPREYHLIAFKRCLRYVKSTIDNGVMMSNNKNMNNNAKVCGYTYFDFSEDQYEKKSIPDYLFMIGGAWNSR